MASPSGYTSRETCRHCHELLPDPLALFFLLGLAARLLRSDLRVPESLYAALSVGFVTPLGDARRAALALGIPLYHAEVALPGPEKFP